MKKVPKIFYIVMAMLPLIFFTLFEISLRIAGYGADIRQWVSRGDKYIINPDVASRYFNHVNILPATIEDVFDIEKKENAYRVFVLGGSTAAGFPYMPMGSFSRYIRKRLEMNYPDKTIEVVNIAMAAVNSYTLLDLLPGVIEQQPDVILIYAGHNEYYGALGAGSMESLGNSRVLVNTILYLNHFKTIQLIRDLINGTAAKMTAQGETRSGTLMARMAEKKLIAYGSPLFRRGINQFEGNLRAILKACKDAGIPLLLGTLTSNAKDQQPFKSVESSQHPPAREVFKRARLALSNNNMTLADSLFMLAKDLDALRFRAPNEINEVITDLGKEYHVPVVDVDSVFRAASRHHIVGDELITDHLHPTIEGYRLMGKTYYECLHDNGLLPEDRPVYAFENQHRLTVENVVITDLDRKIGDFTIIKLKNDWPFIHPEEKRPLAQIIDPHTRVEALSLQVANNEKRWLVAHMDMARTALTNHDMVTFLRHMDVLIYQYPIAEESYDLVIHELLKSGLFSHALPYLQMRYKLGNNAYISKWIGIILLSRGEGKEGSKYLERSVALNPGDPQTLFNLCVGYLSEGHYGQARQALKSCLDLDPDFPGGDELFKKLEND